MLPILLLALNLAAPCESLAGACASGNDDPVGDARAGGAVHATVSGGRPAKPIPIARRAASSAGQSGRQLRSVDAGRRAGTASSRWSAAAALPA